MGIPRFFPRMRAAGHANVRAEIGRKGSDTKTHAIIDAAAFAHFILSTLEGEKGAYDGRTLRLDSAVTYADCAERATQWLDDLETYGFVIDGIYFDGALPATKRQTRIDRLKSYAKNLDDYRKRHERTLTGKATLGELAGLHGARQHLPPKPFIVYTVLDALLQSRYNNVTFVVPGEADNYCVAAALLASHEHQDQDTAILSNDSDLAVFPVGPETTIILLNTIELQEADDTASRMLATTYKPAHIARKLSLPHLLPLAFHLWRDPHVSVAQAQTWLVHDEVPLDEAWPDFVHLYYTANEEKILSTFRRDDAQRQLFLGLDARVSELVQQAQAQNGRAQPSELEMFMPFLTEDSSRASAWRMGIRVRDVAYNILLQVSACPEATILEYKRSGVSIGGRNAGLDPRDRLPEELLSQWNDCFHDMLDYIHIRTMPERWRFIVLQTMLCDFRAQDMTLPLPDQLVSTIIGKPCTHWHMVQLSAQYQAAFYSLRILMQILRYAYRSTAVAKIPQLLDAGSPHRKLLKLLEGMPSIAAFFSPDTELDIIENAEDQTDWKNLIEQALADVDDAYIRKQSDIATYRKKKKRKNVNGKFQKIHKWEAGSKKVKAMERVDEKAEDRALASNPYAMLSAV